MAPANKLLMRDASGTAMVAHVVDAALASRAAYVIVVTGHDADAVCAALAKRNVQFVFAPEYATGMAASLAAGIKAVPDDAQAAMICLGDMPLVTATVLNQLIDAYDPARGAGIVVPMRGEQRGNPVVWDRMFFNGMAELSGDSGARSLLTRHRDHVVTIDPGTDAVLQDFDQVHPDWS